MALEKLKRYLKIRNRKAIRDNKNIRNNKTVRNKKTGKYIAAVISLAMMSFIVIYAGLFLYPEKQSPEPRTGNGQNGGSSRNAGSYQTGGNQDGSMNAGDAVVYRHVATKINGLRQEINILEIDAGKPGVKVMPVLSNDMIYGFEYLSRMVSRKGAYAAVNAGFFSQYGLPSGMVVEDGKLIKSSRGEFPVFTLAGGKAGLQQVKSRLLLEAQGASIKVDSLNSEALKGWTAVYTPVYGSDSREKKKSYTVIIRNGKVAGAGFYNGAVEIPRDGFIISRFLTAGETEGTYLNEVKPGNHGSADNPGQPGVRGNPDGSLLLLKTGDAVDLVHEPPLSPDMQAYECGSWLIKDGRVVIGDRDPWIGVLTNRDPRTAIGIMADGKVLLITVDGRQEGYSAGMTGRELGDYMLGLGAVSAAMLDGGASTEMIFDGKMVNRPSFKGQERPLGGGILVFSGR